ncbi:hypothetical protein JCM8202v2_003841 [Rhodotorula sphaerocarpa]
MLKTQGLVLSGKDAPFELQNIEIGEPQPNACGLCHTDLIIQNGTFPSPFPCVVGHEGAGTVVSVGSDVTRVQLGDEVLLSYANCAQCGYCKSGHPAGCPDFFARNFERVRNSKVGAMPVGKVSASQSDLHGTFFGQSALARHCLAVETSVVKVKKGLDLALFAPLGCGLQSGAGPILNVLKPSETSSVIIFGLGAVGFGALWASVYRKVQTVIVVDLVLSRRELALSQGATHAFDGRSPTLLEDVRQVTEGMGAEYAIEATGVHKVLRTAWECIRNLGRVVSVGNPGPGYDPPFEMYADGHFPIESIVKHFPAERFHEALAAMKSGEVIKPVILF